MDKRKKSGGRQWPFAGRRSISLDFFLILPLLIAYEIGIDATHSNFRNAAEVILKDICLLMGTHYARYFHWLLAAAVVLFFLRSYSEKPPYFAALCAVIAESVLLALLLGPLLSGVVYGLGEGGSLAAQSGPGPSTPILLSIGAGVYEEILFRFLILGGGYAFCRHVFRLPAFASAAAALLSSSLLFALYHHIGPFGQPIFLPLLLFRTAAGIALGLVFIFRGFAVVVYLHAFYDIFRDIEATLR